LPATLRSLGQATGPAGAGNPHPDAGRQELGHAENPTVPQSGQAGLQQATADGPAAPLRCTGLVDQHRTDLAWYHAVGKLVRHLHDAIPAARRGTGWAAALADALGVSPSLLQKATRFVLLYPSPQDVQRLGRLGLDWTHLYLTFAVEDARRSAFQERAVREGWTPQEVRFRIQQAQGSRQRAGGRPRRLPAGYGPEVALREMARLSQRWQEFHEQIWEEEAIARQLKLLPRERYTEALLRALHEAEAALAYLGEHWAGVQATVTALRQRVERVLEKAETAR
jgi:hypothetical protein